VKHLLSKAKDGWKIMLFIFNLKGDILFRQDEWLENEKKVLKFRPHISEETFNLT